MRSESHTIEMFVQRVLSEGASAFRDFPWRRTSDPYEILVSEIMLQQTQVCRVVPYYERWLDLFPSLEALAAAPLHVVLEAWQGLGYNRRALALKRLAERLVEQALPGAAARLPDETSALVALPGIGPATAAGVQAFAFGRHAPYLETNVRSVFLHELFADAERVPDSEIRPLVEEAAEKAEQLGIDAQTWNYALLDYGAHLKRTRPNPSRRSAHHARQSKFEGSSRQRRARLLRLVMARPGETLDEYSAELEALDARDGRGPVTPAEAQRLLEDLVADGFLAREGERYYIA